MPPSLLILAVALDAAAAALLAFWFAGLTG
jgi:hypothetical protein